MLAGRGGLAAKLQRREEYRRQCNAGIRQLQRLLLLLRPLQCTHSPDSWCGPKLISEALKMRGHRS